MLSGMVNGSFTDSVISNMGEMNNSPFIFELTGSRKFGCATAQSDWDFFVQYSEEVVRFLANHYFTDVTRDTGYQDVSLIKIYEKNCSDGSIHIQLVQDFDAKLMAQNALFRVGLPTYGMSKEEARKIWNIALLLVNQLKKCS